MPCPACCVGLGSTHSATPWSGAAWIAAETRRGGRQSSTVVRGRSEAPRKVRTALRPPPGKGLRERAARGHLISPKSQAQPLGQTLYLPAQEAKSWQTVVTVRGAIKPSSLRTLSSPPPSPLFLKKKYLFSF